MMIYQMHEQHGRHIAYTTLEAEDNRKNGWKDVKKEEFYPTPRKTVDTTKVASKKGKKGGS